MNRLLLPAIAIAFTLSLHADISIIPATPTTGVPVTIRVDNSYATVATLRNAAISRTGNVFEIVQNVDYACPAIAPLPAIVRTADLSMFPTVTAQFQLAALPSGSYTVRSTTYFTTTSGTCSNTPFVRTKNFAVTESVPLLDDAVQIALAATLALMAFARFQRL